MRPWNNPLKEEIDESSIEEILEIGASKPKENKILDDCHIPPSDKIAEGFYRLRYICSLRIYKLKK